MSFDEFNSLNKDELKEALKVATKIINTTKKQLKSKGLWSPALNYTSFKGGVRGKSFTDMKSDLFQGLALLKAKSFSVKGARSVKENFTKKVCFDTGNDERTELFWTLYHRLQSNDQTRTIFFEYGRYYGSVQQMNLINDHIPQKGVQNLESIYNSITNELYYWYRHEN